MRTRHPRPTEKEKQASSFSIDFRFSVRAAESHRENERKFNEKLFPCIIRNLQKKCHAANRRGCHSICPKSNESPAAGNHETPSEWSKNVLTTSNERKNTCWKNKNRTKTHRKHYWYFDWWCKKDYRLISWGQCCSYQNISRVGRFFAIFSF